MDITLDQLLYSMMVHEATALLLKPDLPPITRVHNNLVPLDCEILEPYQTRELCLSKLSALEQEAFARDLDWKADWRLPALGNVHVSLFFARGNVCGVFRRESTDGGSGPDIASMICPPIGPSRGDLPGPSGAGAGVGAPLRTGPPSRAAGFEEPLPDD